MSWNRPNGFPEEKLHILIYARHGHRVEDKATIAGKAPEAHSIALLSCMMGKREVSGHN